MKIYEHNVETGEAFLRDATENEIAQFEADAADRAIQKAEAQAKAEAKSAAQAKLAALGLTVEDLQALGL